MISTTQKKTLAGFVLALILAGVLGTLARAGMLRPACLLAASELALLCGVWGLTRRDSLERGAQQARMEAADDDLTIANSRLEHASQRFAELYQALPIPCACSDTDGRIFEWNRAFEACFGLPAEQIFLRAVWEATGTPEQTPRIREIAARVSAGEAVTDWEQVCRLPDGTERHLLCSAHPLRDRDGRITGSISTYLDITERKRAEEARRAAEERYRDVFEDALEGIFQSTPDGRFLSVNPAMARMFGYDTPQEMVAAVTDIQRQFWVRPQDRAGFRERLGRDGSVTAFEGQFRKKGGAPLWISMNVRAARDGAGRVRYYEGLVADIAERKRMEEALRGSEERLRAFHEITSAPQVGFEEKVEHLLRLGCREFGMYAGIVAQMDTQEYRIRHAVSPDDAVAAGFVCDTADTICQETVRRGQPVAIEHVGATDWRHHPAYALFGPEAYLGTPLRVGGETWGALCFTHSRPRMPFTDTEKDFLRLMAQWIGGEIERRNSRQAILDSEERFRSAIGSMQEGLLVQDEAGTVVLCNEGAQRILGVPAEDLLYRPATRADWRVIRPDGSGFPRAEQPSRMALATGRPQQDVVLGIARGSDVTWLSMNAAPLSHAGDERPYAAVVTFTDITERRRQEAQIAAHLEQIQDYAVVLEYQKQELEAANATLEALATQDGLTGLKNHRAFQEKMETEVRHARRYNVPLSLILLDVDKFKQYNDTYGHPAGDEVLKMVGRLLGEGIRDTDFAARYGGEEFAVVLPNTDGDGAQVVAERLRAAIEANPWSRRAVTASLGVSTLAPAMANRADLIAAADQALYASKSAGRNRAIHAADLMREIIAPLAA